VNRTFVALLIPDAWRDYIFQATRVLRSKLPGLAWVKPENLHLTVRFLGDLDDAAVARAGESVRRSAAPLRAPTARLGQLGAFPRPESPSVLWIGFESGRQEIEAVANAVEDGLERDGFGSADKPFRAHVTVARVRKGTRVGDLARTPFPEPRPEGILDRLAVMKSELHPSGARYNVFQELRLPLPGA
jgi:2'-5' RNA ligase